MKKSNLIGEPTRYKINLFNLQAKTQKFWCFLNKPISTPTPEVYANSNASINISTYTGTQKASFTVPLQYKLEVGASNKAVKLKTLIESSDTHDTQLGVGWNANYTQQKNNNVPPVLKTSGQSAPAGQLAVVTNEYDKDKEALNNWYGNMTFGIETDNGFIGVSWSPDPGTTYEIEPIIGFYVAIGNYSQNELASIAAVSTKAATLTQDSFDAYYQCTVIYQTDGSWVVKKGYSPPTPTSLLANMVNAHTELISAHKNLVEMVQASYTVDDSDSSQNLSLSPSPTIEERESTGIELYGKSHKKNRVDSDFEFITGSITVGVAIAAGFAYMFASSIKLTITSTSADGLTIDFKYDGEAGKQAILDAFAAGQSIFFGS